MITSMEIQQSEDRIRSESRNDYLMVEVWENDNTIITDGFTDSKFEFEISKENAIKMALTILASYKFSPED